MRIFVLYLWIVLIFLSWHWGLTFHQNNFLKQKDYKDCKESNDHHRYSKDKILSSSSSFLLMTTNSNHEENKIPTSLQTNLKRKLSKTLHRSMIPLSAAFLTYSKQQPLLSTQAMGQLPEYSKQSLLFQDICLNVQDLNQEIAMITELFQGKAKELRRYTKQTTEGDQEIYAVIGFGPDTFQKPSNFLPGVSNWNYYGGHQTITLRSKLFKENEGGAGGGGGEDIVELTDRGNGLQCIKFGVSMIRLSKAIEKGAKVKYSYGWIDLDSPNNLPYHVIIGDRFDPIVAPYIRVRNLTQTAQWLEETLGMIPLPFPLARTPGSMYEPIQPKNSLYYGYTPDNLGILLLNETFDSFKVNSGNTLFEADNDDARKGKNGFLNAFENVKQKKNKPIVEEPINIGTQLQAFTILVDDQQKDMTNLPTVIQQFLQNKQKQQLISSPDGYPFRLITYSSFQQEATTTVPFDLSETVFPSLPVTNVNL